MMDGGAKVLLSSRSDRDDFNPVAIVELGLGIFPGEECFLVKLDDHGLVSQSYRI